MISDNNNNKNFKSLGIFELKMRDGVQLFSIDYNVLDDTSLKDKIKGIKIVIKSAFGGNKTYINQIMMYENTLQEINGLNEYIQNINDKKEEINLPGDLSNSQISLEENERLNKKPYSNDENGIKMEKTKNEEINNFNKNIQNKKNTFEKIIKKQYKTDNISNSFSKNSEIKESKNINNKEENDDFINKNPKEEQEEEEENEEINDIIPTSNDLRSPQTNKYERNYSPANKNSNRNKEKPINEKPNKKEKNIKNNQTKKFQKLEKILKQNILRNDFKTNENKVAYNNLNNEQLEIDRNGFKNKYNYINNNTYDNISNYTSPFPQINNNYNNPNNNFERNNMIDDNNIQKYFILNSNTPNRFTVSGNEYLINKMRPNTPKLNEINRNTIPMPNRNEYKNKTSMEGFIENNINNKNNNILNNKAYETLEIQLQDMEQHIENMALKRDFSSNSNNNYTSKTNRDTGINNNKYMNNDIYINNNYINKKTKNYSMISNTSSYANDEQININTNNTADNIYNNPNRNVFTKYNAQNLNINNEDDVEINKRIDNLEKSIFEIKDELNNISSNLNLFLNNENFLYNFRDSIKQICYEYFYEIMNMEKSEPITDRIDNENENDEEKNSQDSREFSENKNEQNESKKIEEEINKKIDEKLEYLCDGLKEQIFEKYLQPSINEIEKSMRQNIEDIKDKVDSITDANNLNQIRKTSKYYNNNLGDESNNELYSKYGDNNSKDDIYHKTSSKLKREKYEEINRLGEKLYDKLLEKERKLKMLNKATMKSMEKNNSFKEK